MEKDIILKITEGIPTATGTVGIGDLEWDYELIPEYTALFNAYSVSPAWDKRIKTYIYNSTFPVTNPLELRRQGQNGTFTAAVQGHLLVLALDDTSSTWNIVQGEVINGYKVIESSGDIGNVTFQEL